MSSSSLLTAFNDHFIEFVDDIIRVFPDNADIITAKEGFVHFRKLNPKMTVKIWTTYVVGKYINEIESGNINFFINKDYSQDLTSTKYSATIMEGIDRLRNPVKLMDHEDQLKAMKYIQNLTKLSFLYNQSG